MQRDNIHARTHDTAWIKANIWRQDGAICSKNRKNAPYHVSTRIPRLTVSLPDYGSWYTHSLEATWGVAQIHACWKLWLGRAEAWVLLYVQIGFNPGNEVCESESNISMAEGGNEPELGGYDYEFTSNVPDYWECLVCHLTLKDPVQIEKCGHRLCNICMESLFR